MAELFQTTQQNISLHLQNIYAEGELQLGATHKESLSVRLEGRRTVRRRVDFYNLDAILSLGYRVKSAVATRFRIWATRLLREYIVKGFLLQAMRRCRCASSRNTASCRTGCSSHRQPRIAFSQYQDATATVGR